MSKSKAIELVAAVICLVAGGLASQISVDRMSAIATALAAFAGVVVTVFGIWVAIIFPRLLAGLEAGAKSQEMPERVRYRALIESLYRSCFVLCASSLVFLLISFFGNDTKFFAKAFSAFCWLSFLSISSSLWKAVVSGDGAVAAGMSDGILTGTRRRIRGRGQKQRKNERG